MFLAPKLKNRVEIQKVEDQDAFDDGRLDNNYTTIKTIWAKVESVQDAAIFRGQNTADTGTHRFTVRRDAVRSSGTEYSSAFDEAFKAFADLNPIKSDYFLYLKKGATKGRRFRILGTSNDEQHDEFIKIRTMEMEEIGTGYRE